jgi:hypothetical protein
MAASQHHGLDDHNRAPQVRSGALNDGCGVGSILANPAHNDPNDTTSARHTAEDLARSTSPGVDSHIFGVDLSPRALPPRPFQESDGGGPSPRTDCPNRASLARYADRTEHRGARSAGLARCYVPERHFGHAAGDGRRRVMGRVIWDTLSSSTGGPSRRSVALAGSSSPVGGERCRRYQPTASGTSRRRAISGVHAAWLSGNRSVVSSLRDGPAPPRPTRVMIPLPVAAHRAPTLPEVVGWRCEPPGAAP